MMLISTMGCYSPRHRNRLLDVKNQTMDQRRKIAMTSLVNKIAQSSVMQKNNETAQVNVQRLWRVERIVGLTGQLCKHEVDMLWKKDSKEEKGKPRSSRRAKDQNFSTWQIQPHAEQLFSGTGGSFRSSLKGTLRAAAANIKGKP